MTWGTAWRMLVALPVGFLVLLGIFWAGIALAKCLKRHSGRLRSNLSASPTVPVERPDDDGASGKEL